MRTHFHSELNELQAAVLTLGEAVSNNVVQAVEAFRDDDRELATSVMRADRDIDRREVRNEEDCLQIIALHQPVADDLRYLVAMLKINHELERVSDLAVDIAEDVYHLSPTSSDPWGERLANLADEASKRLTRVLAAFVHQDAEAARELWLADAGIDERTRTLKDELRQAITIANPGDDQGSLLAVFSAADQVERLADHIKNIAKDVIYLVLGEIVRHRSQDFLDTIEDSGSCPNGATRYSKG